ncbi:MAG: hypothetical protein OXH13_09645 [Chloroflexi bacterium]|nr:hypothetical protein [Chloroflexota bacterium]MCY3697733.1 hypothetical protein [Chloroflexota bacterium]
MNEGVTIGFAVIAAVFGGIGLLLFKEARTHRFWRQLVADNDMKAIRGILDQEIEHWRTQRPPKDVSAMVWAGVQGLDLVGASAEHVRVSTSADPEFGVVDGSRQQIASSLDTAYATAMRLVEMIFYDLPNYRPGHVRVDVYTTFRDPDGKAEALPILSVQADRASAMSLDWNQPPAVLAREFETTADRAPNGEPRPIELPDDPFADMVDDTAANAAN